MADPATKTEIESSQEALPDPPKLAVSALELCLDAGSVTEVFRAIAATIDQSKIMGDVDGETVRAALLERERESSTAIGFGAAIPHARVEGLSESILLDVKLRKPVRWDEGQDVERCMIILVPPEAHDQHLQLTAHAVRELIDE
jgi:mannitol/fructose-specific phosphotransferase system IIA component (Ntr-type)